MVLYTNEMPLEQTELNGMDTKGKLPGTNRSILSRKELLELHERVVKRVRKMTPKEGFKSLIASGIYTADGKLTKEYADY